MTRSSISIGVLSLGLISGGANATEDPPAVPHEATIVIQTDAPAKTYDPMLFGGFIEHLGKQIYGGFSSRGRRWPTRPAFVWMSSRRSRN